jgi:hypothetical protein
MRRMLNDAEIEVTVRVLRRRYVLVRTDCLVMVRTKPELMTGSTGIYRLAHDKQRIVGGRSPASCPLPEGTIDKNLGTL